MTNLDKARAMGSALDALFDEYSGRPDVQAAVTAFQEAMSAPQLQLLFDLVVWEREQA